MWSDRCLRSRNPCCGEEEAQRDRPLYHTGVYQVVNRNPYEHETWRRDEGGRRTKYFGLWTPRFSAVAVWKLTLKIRGRGPQSHQNWVTAEVAHWVCLRQARRYGESAEKVRHWKRRNERPESWATATEGISETARLNNRRLKTTNGKSETVRHQNGNSPPRTGRPWVGERCFAWSITIATRGQLWKQSWKAQSEQRSPNHLNVAYKSDNSNAQPAKLHWAHLGAKLKVKSKPNACTFESESCRETIFAVLSNRARIQEQVSSRHSRTRTFPFANE